MGNPFVGNILSSTSWSLCVTMSPGLLNGIDHSPVVLPISANAASTPDTVLDDIGEKAGDEYRPNNNHPEQTELPQVLRLLLGEAELAPSRHALLGGLDDQREREYEENGRDGVHLG